MNRFFAAVLLIFFAGAMTVKGMANAIVFLTGLLSIPFIREYRQQPQQARYLFLVMLLVPLLTLLQIVSGMDGVTVNGMDAPLRLLFAGLSLWGLVRLPARYFTPALWGILIGACGLGFWGWLSQNVDAYRWDAERAWNGFSHPIAFGVYAVLFASWTCVLPSQTLCSSAAGRKWLSLLKGLAVLVALLAAYASESRSAQFVMIPTLLLLFFYRLNLPRIQKAALMVGLAVVAVLVVSLSPDRISTRVREGVAELQHYDASLNTSMGMRVTMWKFAVDVIKEHPWTGVGRKGYYREVVKLQQESNGLQFISASPHPHNELLNFAVEFGIVGLLVGLALYAIPALIFGGVLNSQDPILSFAGMAGMMAVAVQFMAGLFDTYFWIVSQTSFYGMSVVIFASMIFSRKRELGLS